MKKIMTAAHVDPDQPIHLGSLLEDMLDRTRIAGFPQSEFTCKQASSCILDRSPSKGSAFASVDHIEVTRYSASCWRR